jgi:PAS domain S-box-containing protein
MSPALPSNTRGLKKACAEAKYRDLIDVSPDAIYIIDTDLTYVLANPAGAELAGCTQEELIGTPIAETSCRKNVPCCLRGWR